MHFHVNKKRGSTPLNIYALLLSALHTVWKSSTGQRHWFCARGRFCGSDCSSSSLGYAAESSRHPFHFLLKYKSKSSDARRRWVPLTPRTWRQGAVLSLLSWLICCVRDSVATFPQQSSCIHLLASRVLKSDEEAATAGCLPDLSQMDSSLVLLESLYWWPQCDRTL